MKPDSSHLEESLARLANARVVVCGDFALDVHWDLADDDGELSIETGLPVRKVRSERIAPGGAGNVAQNARALGAAVFAVGIAGEDFWGDVLLETLALAEIDTCGFDRIDGWHTPVFVKPMRDAEEQPRFDFGAFNTIDESNANALFARLALAVQDADAFVLNQQIQRGLLVDTNAVRANSFAASVACPSIVDARDHGAAFPGTTRKLNLEEGRRLLHRSDASAAEIAAELHDRDGMPVFVTAGRDGMWFVDPNTAGHVAAPGIDGPIDPCGAGDTVVAMLAAALGVGISSRDASKLAMLAAAVVVRKIGTTGTASPDEILAEARR